MKGSRKASREAEKPILCCTVAMLRGRQVPKCGRCDSWQAKGCKIPPLNKIRESACLGDTISLVTLDVIPICILQFYVARMPTDEEKKIIPSVKYFFQNLALNWSNYSATTMHLSHSGYYNSRIVHSQTHNSFLFERVLTAQTHQAMVGM